MRAIVSSFSNGRYIATVADGNTIFSTDKDWMGRKLISLGVTEIDPADERYWDSVNHGVPKLSMARGRDPTMQKGVARRAYESIRNRIHLAAHSLNGHKK